MLYLKFTKYLIARFSPDDPYQRERYENKKRFNILLTQ